MKTFRLGYLGNLRLLAKATVIPGALALWLILGTVGAIFLNFSVETAVFFGLLATLLHLFSEFWHQLGHAWAAQRTGYPMSGILFNWVLGVSLYPRDEPDLSGRIHVRRALGGPPASLLLALVAGILTLALRPSGSLGYGLALFTFLDNLLVFTLGAFLPLGFTDGSTLLRYWRD